MAIKKETYDVWLTLLKGATYAFGTSAATAAVQYVNEGVDLKTCVIYGVVVGVLAAIKNVVKFKFGIDLDFAALKK